MALAVWQSGAILLMTSAEQATGKAAPVVSIKSENGQNARNSPSTVPQPAPRTRVLLNTGTGHLVRSKPLPVLGSGPSRGLWAGQQPRWL